MNTSHRVKVARYTNTKAKEPSAQRLSSFICRLMNTLRSRTPLYHSFAKSKKENERNNHNKQKD